MNAYAVYPFKPVENIPIPDPILIPDPIPDPILPVKIKPYLSPVTRIHPVLQTPYQQPDYNTCLKMIKSKSPYEMYYRPKENIKKSIIPIKKNGKKN
jgi:hypothetical protein